MKNFQEMQQLIGASLTEQDLQYVDCYVYGSFGLFIPFADGCKYGNRLNHSHPAYMIILRFDDDSNVYKGSVWSPDVIHSDDLNSKQYYCIMIGKEMFEKVLLQYSHQISSFSNQTFYVCKDILKVLNLFAFEYTKEMMNSAITLEAQSTVLTHWLIRSILGENFDILNYLIFYNSFISIFFFNFQFNLIL